MYWSNIWNTTRRITASPKFIRRTAIGVGITSAVFSTVYLTERSTQPTRVFAWGYAGFGQLGLQSEINAYNPAEIDVLADKNVVTLHAGKSISMALTSNGEVYSWGKNKGGILGHTDRTSFNLTQPQRIEALLGVRVSQISCGQFHMAAVTEDGALYTWGNKEYGKLAHAVPAPAANAQKFVFKRGNQAYDYLDESKLPEKVAGLDSVHCKQVACGGQFTAVLSQDGKVFTFGENAKGVLGYQTDKRNVEVPTEVTDLKDIVKIDAGHDFCAAINSQGKLFTWGNNRNGQLGNNANIYQTKPSQVYGFPSTSSIVDISCGDNFIAALTHEGKLFTWGYGSDGQLGHGNKSDLYAPQLVEFKEKISRIACGGSHSAFITESGKLFLFGRGSEGQLGIGQNMESEASYRSSPKLVEFFKDQKVTQVACGGEHTIAVTVPLSAASAAPQKKK